MLVICSVTEKAHNIRDNNIFVRLISGQILSSAQQESLSCWFLKPLHTLMHAVLTFVSALDDMQAKLVI